MIVLIGVVYILTRSLGKYLGAHYSAKLMKCEPQICKYLGITLLPQAGVALGMCVTARQLGAEGDLIRNITLFAILIYELVGPLLTKMALQARSIRWTKPSATAASTSWNRPTRKRNNTQAQKQPRPHGRGCFAQVAY